ncbi:hypothetical protein D187_009875 [Cystobacter fuscus DSM 2262]|uniref:Uncharacterized protein n=1 Tax=Cystobacter fuscus (strain ATCC 25194 / DSM 2262 / NBRC 100088 / M29) TaxID=1242864 RepID=S9PHU0_CYSF2|nr:hypothetical protein D187_009875 [Cystobacter fuscus DSM 2262]
MYARGRTSLQMRLSPVTPNRLAAHPFPDIFTQGGVKV